MRAVVVEDVDDLRATMKQAMRLEGFDVVGEARDGSTAAETARQTNPDLVVLDLGLPDLAGSELIAQMRSAAPTARIVIYTGQVDFDRGALGGVDAFVTKDKSVRDLVSLLTSFDRPAEWASIALGPALGDVARGRRFLREQAAKNQFGDEAGAAELVMSELVTNAIVHGGTSCELRVRYAPDLLRIEVKDGGVGSPDLRPFSETSVGGRGLIIVSMLSEAWGVDNDPAGGKIVWAELRPNRRPTG